MTQNTLKEYTEELQELKKQQKENIKVYNRKQTKKSKLKVMQDLIMPLEKEMEEIKNGRTIKN